MATEKDTSSIPRFEDSTAVQVAPVFEDSSPIGEAISSQVPVFSDSQPIAQTETVVPQDKKPGFGGTLAEVPKGLARGVQQTEGAVGSAIEMVGDYLNTQQKQWRRIYYNSPIGQKAIAKKQQRYIAEHGWDEYAKDSISETPKTIGDAVADFGVDVSDYWTEAAQTGWERRNEAIYSGTFKENPSLARVIGGVSESAPTMIAALGLSVAGQPGAGAALLAGSEALPVYTEAKKMGATEKEAFTFSFISGVGTAALEKFGLNAIVGNNPVVNGVIKKMGAKWYAGALANYATEATQESLQEIWQNAVAMGYDGNRKLFDGAFEAGIIGGVMGAGGGGGRVLINDYMQRRGDQTKGLTDQQIDQLVRDAADPKNAPVATADVSDQGAMDVDLTKQAMDLADIEQPQEVKDGDTERTETVGAVEEKEKGAAEPEKQDVQAKEEVAPKPPVEAEKPAPDTKPVSAEKVAPEAPVAREKATTPPKTEKRKPLKQKAPLEENQALRQEDSRALLTAVGSDRKSDYESTTDKKVFESVRNEGMVEDAYENARRLLKSKKEHSDKEHIAFVLSTNEKIQEVNELNKRMAKMVENGEDISDIDAAKSVLLEEIETIALASDRSGSELGKALRARRLKPDMSYDEASVRARATVVKGDKLTEAQAKNVAEKTQELKEWEELATELQKDIDKLEAQSSKTVAKSVVDELATVKITRKKVDILKARKDAKEKLSKLGYRVNDITGLPIDVAKILSEIAVTHIQEGATTLEQVVSKTIADVPDASQKNVYDALGGRAKKKAKKAETEVQGLIKELKGQAKLHGQIEDAVDGVLDPTRKSPPTSAEIKDLKNKLKLYSASVKNTELDNTRTEQVLERMAEIDDMIDRVHRPIKVVRTKSKELKTAERALRVKGKELSAQDRIAVLEEILRDGENTKPISDQPETSQRLEKFRAEISYLKELIAEKKAPAKLAEKERKAERNRQKRINDAIKKLTGEIEQFYREIPKASPLKKMTGREAERDALLLGKKQQNMIADLLEVLRRGKVSEKVAKTATDDPYGYGKTIKNLREEIQRQEWYQEWRQIKRETAKLAKTTEQNAELKRRIDEEDYEGFITPKVQRTVLNEKLIEAELRQFQLKQEINRRIRALKPKTWRNYAHDVYNIPRSAKLTLDIGHILRQGGFALSNPRKMNILKFGNASFQALASQEKADIINKWIIDQPEYERLREAGYHIVEQGEEMHGVERILQENLLDDIPYIGKAVEASARTQLTSMNLLRTQMGIGYLKRHPNTTDAELKEVAEVHNIVTGYGIGKHVAQIAPVMDNFLTSTRFTASRLQAPFLLANPKYLKNKNLRNELIEDTMWFWGTRVAVMALAAGLWPDEFEIGKNPDHHTFGKLIVKLPNGNSRIYDPWAGLQQTARVIKKLAKGDNQPLADFASEMAKKVNPAISLIHAVHKGKKYPNEDISRTEALIRGFTPISLEGVADSVIDETGMADMFVAGIMDIIGLNSYVVPSYDLRGKTDFKDRDKD